MIEVPRFAFLSSLLLLHPSYVQLFSLASCYRTPSMCVLSRPSLTPMLLIPIRLYVCSLFNYAFQWLRPYSVQWKGDRWVMNWKGCGRKRSWPNVKVVSQHLSLGTEDYEDPQDSWSPCQDSNPRPPFIARHLWIYTEQSVFFPCSIELAHMPCLLLKRQLCDIRYQNAWQLSGMSPIGSVPGAVRSARRMGKLRPLC
jgi:hypothetical protein